MQIDYEAEDNEDNSSPIILVQCPFCKLKFAEDKVEEHVSVCCFSIDNG